MECVTIGQWILILGVISALNVDCDIKKIRSILIYLVQSVVEIWMIIATWDIPMKW